MKKCFQCGAIMDNQYETCHDCGARLGPALSEEEVKKLEKNVSKSSGDESDATDYFHVNRQDRLVSILLLCGVVIHLFLLYAASQVEMENYRLMVYIIMIWMTIEAFNVINPRITWKLYQMRFSLQPSNQKELHSANIALHLRRGIAFVALFSGYSFLIYRCLRLLIP